MSKFVAASDSVNFNIIVAEVTVVRMMITIAMVAVMINILEAHG